MISMVLHARQTTSQMLNQMPEGKIKLCIQICRRMATLRKFPLGQRCKKRERKKNESVFLVPNNLLFPHTQLQRERGEVGGALHL